MGQPVFDSYINHIYIPDEYDLSSENREITTYSRGIRIFFTDKSINFSGLGLNCIYARKSIGRLEAGFIDETSNNS